MSSVDYEKEGDPLKFIRDFLKKNQVEVLVGYPSGRQHIPTLHGRKTKQKNGKKTTTYKGYNDEDNPQDLPAIDTDELAKILSFGSATIPARPFLKESIEHGAKKIKSAMQDELAKGMLGAKPNWKKIGSMAVGQVQEFVRSDYYKSSVPNSKKTIEYKGSDTPLIDGADLVNATSFIVKENIK